MFVNSLQNTAEKLMNDAKISLSLTKISIYILALTLIFVGIFFISVEKNKNIESNIVKKEKVTIQSTQTSYISDSPQPIKSGKAVATPDPSTNDNDLYYLSQLIEIIPNPNKDFSDYNQIQDISKDPRISLGDISLLSAEDAFGLYKWLIFCQTFNEMSWTEKRNYKLDDIPSIQVDKGEEINRRIDACETINETDYRRAHDLLLHAAKKGLPNAQHEYASTTSIWTGGRYKTIQELERSTDKEEMALAMEVREFQISLLNSLHKNDYHIATFELGYLYASNGLNRDQVKALTYYLIFYSEMKKPDNFKKFLASFSSDTMRPVDIQLAVDAANKYLDEKYNK